MSQLNSKMDFDELLAPYVQGNVDEKQRKFVEERAEFDSECNEKLKFEQQIASSIKQSSEKFQEITPSFDSLKKQINKSPIKNAWWKNLFGGQDTNNSRFNSGLVLASFTAICLGMYMLFSQQIDSNLVDDYETLSNGDSTLVLKDDRHYLRIVLADKLSKDKVIRLVEELKFTIESGPDSLNSYIISFSDEHSLSDEDLNSWRKDSRFDLVEPIPNVKLEYY
jgi:hypothetical protein